MPYAIQPAPATKQACCPPGKEASAGRHHHPSPLQTTHPSPSNSCVARPQSIPLCGTGEQAAAIQGHSQRAKRTSPMLKHNLSTFASPSSALRAILDKTMDPPKANTSLPTKAPPTLLTIAGELRNQIYSYLLVEEAILYPYDNRPCSPDCPKHHRHDPNVTILAVNKQINAEATPILYSNATFRLTTGHNLMRFLNKGDHICMFQAPTLEFIFPSRHLIRNLQIKFVPEHTPAEFRDQRNVDLWADADFRAKTTSERAQFLHQNDRDLSEMVWFNAGVTIPKLRALKSLTLDIEQCFCPMGCCRMTSQLIASLEGLKTKKGIKLVINGSLLPDEEHTIRKALICEHDRKPAKPTRDRALDAQHIRDVFEALYSSSESDVEDDSLEDEEDSDEDDEEDESEDDSAEDEGDSDEEEDEDDSSDSETSGDVDEDVRVAKADVEMLEASSSVTDACSPSDVATDTTGGGQNNEHGTSHTDSSAANSPHDRLMSETTTVSGAAPTATNETDSLRILNSEDVRRLIVTVNPTSLATDPDNRSAVQRHKVRRLSKQGKATAKPSGNALLKSIKSAHPSLPSPFKPIHTDGPSASTNDDGNMDDLIDLDSQDLIEFDDVPNWNSPTNQSASQRLDQEL